MRRETQAGNKLKCQHSLHSMIRMQILYLRWLVLCSATETEFGTISLPLTNWNHKPSVAANIWFKSHCVTRRNLLRNQIQGYHAESSRLKNFAHKPVCGEDLFKNRPALREKST
jgi:hypothetical protein